MAFGQQSGVVSADSDFEFTSFILLLARMQIIHIKNKS